MTFIVVEGDQDGDVGDASCFSPAPHGFADVPTTSFANTAITWLVETGITTGSGPGTYSPKDRITRAQMAVFLHRNAGEPAPTGPHGFADVPITSFANTAIAWLVEAGITTGITPTVYSPNTGVTRAQMAVFLHRISCPPPTLPFAAAGTHTCVVKANTTVACWGDNSNGQLGDGTTTDRRNPTPVAGLSGVTAITAGATHTCAATSNGTAYCWGGNGLGQLGDGTTTPRLAPTQVAGLTGVADVTTGSSHTCALTSGGGAACWGWNADGQLGDGTTTQRRAPVAVTGLGDVAAMSAGITHTCAVKRNAAVACWGRNDDGQLGDGTTTQRETPTAVVGL